MRIKIINILLLVVNIYGCKKIDIESHHDYIIKSTLPEEISSIIVMNIISSNVLRLELNSNYEIKLQKLEHVDLPIQYNKSVTIKSKYRLFYLHFELYKNNVLLLSDTAISNIEIIINESEDLANEEKVKESEYEAYRLLVNIMIIKIQSILK